MRDYHVLSMDRIGGQGHRPRRRARHQGRALGWPSDVGARRRGEGRPVLPLFPGEGQGRTPSASAWRWAARPRDRSRRSPQPIKGTFSIDPCVFKDTDGQHYMYFGGIWGGQLQRWATGSYVAEGRLSGEGPAGDQREGGAARRRHAQPRRVAARRRPARRERQAARRRRQRPAVLRRRRGCTSTTGRTTSRIRPATRTSSCTRRGRRRTARSPSAARSSSRCSAGPITTRSSSSRGSGTSSTTTRSCRGGQTHLRNIKVTELKYRPDGSIETIDAYRE